jgi:hypothetical protein
MSVRDASVLEVIKNYVRKRPRFGYRRITVELKKDGWYINHVGSYDLVTERRKCPERAGLVKGERKLHFRKTLITQSLRKIGATGLEPATS